MLKNVSLILKAQILLLQLIAAVARMTQAALAIGRMHTFWQNKPWANLWQTDNHHLLHFISLLFYHEHLLPLCFVLSSRDRHLKWYSCQRLKFTVFKKRMSSFSKTTKLFPLLHRSKEKIQNRYICYIKSLLAPTTYKNPLLLNFKVQQHWFAVTNSWEFLKSLII